TWVTNPGWYVVAAGWTAYLKKSASGVQQVWTRSPSGIQAQVSIFGSDSGIETLGDSGDVMFLSGGRRYRAAAGDLPEDVSYEFGVSKEIGGGWYVMMGRTLFHVVGTPIGDAGPGDAGAGDAGD